MSFEIPFAFRDWAEDAQRQICEWANPTMVYSARVTADWPMTHLSQSLVAVGAYGLLVLVGLMMRPADWKAQLDAKKKQLASKPKPTVMENFTSEPIRILQAVYNLCQVLLCAYMIIGTLLVHNERGMGLICNPFDTEDVKMASMLWVFYVSKILDFCDTFFIVWRQAWDRFSFLHIYHHMSIFMVYWMLANVGYAGDIFYTIVANSFIHLLMYYYYLMSSFGATPSWGKYLTQLQMIQFISMNTQAVYILMNNCDYPRKVTLIYLFYIISLFALFMNFYLAKHGKSGKTKRS